jgi:hypothetical protein
VTSNGKGSARRRAGVDAKTLARNWARTFKRRPGKVVGMTPLGGVVTLRDIGEATTSAELRQKIERAAR